MITKHILSICFLATVLYRACLCLEEPVTDKLSLGNPESNILTKRNRDDFIFRVYPPPKAGWGHGKNVADEIQRSYIANWAYYGVQSKADSEGIAYITVNLRRPYFVRAFAVTGNVRGSHKPTGSYFLEGSTGGTDWKMVAEGKADQWHAPGTYPFRPSQIVKAIYPGQYQYYREIAKGWTNGLLLIFNWGLFT